LKAQGVQGFIVELMPMGLVLGSIVKREYLGGRAVQSV